MKKLTALLLVCLLTLSVAAVAMAETFTHPELGEEVTVTRKAVIIYTDEDYTQIPATQTPLGAGGVGMERSTALYEICASYDQQLQSGELKSVDIMNLEPVFKGGIVPMIKALSVEDQAMALLVALGFYDDVINSGFEFSDDALMVFDQIAQNPGKYVNAQQLKKAFPVTTVTINGESVPFMAVSLKIVDKNGVTRTERYGFAQIDGVWTFQQASVLNV